MSENIYPVILAGGSGTRLWPLSTQNHPKQFLQMDSRESLLAQTSHRLKSLASAKHFWVVCGKKHAPQVQEHLPELPSTQILCEPMARNTAPALAWAAFQLAAQNPEAVMVALPADHFIPEDSWPAFSQDIALAAKVAVSQKALVTLGIRPSFASTGFGYLEQGEAHQDEASAEKDSQDATEYFTVQAFHEKPDAQTAARYLDSGRYYWNSGIFVWQVSTFLQALEAHQPKMYQAFAALMKHVGQGSFTHELQKTFEQVDSISVDYAIMEQARRVYMVPAHFSWDDVGSLAALGTLIGASQNSEELTAKSSEASVKAASNNHTSGEVFAVHAQNNIVIAQSKPIALVGVEDLIVVEAEKAVLVLPKSRAQEVKQVVELLKKQGRTDLL